MKAALVLAIYENLAGFAIAHQKGKKPHLLGAGFSHTPLDEEGFIEARQSFESAGVSVAPWAFILWDEHSRLRWRLREDEVTTIQRILGPTAWFPMKIPDTLLPYSRLPNAIRGMVDDIRSPRHVGQFLGRALASTWKEALGATAKDEGPPDTQTPPTFPTAYDLLDA